MRRGWDRWNDAFYIESDIYISSINKLLTSIFEFFLFYNIFQENEINFLITTIIIWRSTIKGNWIIENVFIK